MESWVGLVGWPIADALPTKWSHVNHGSGVDQGKFASYKPTFFPLSHAAKCPLEIQQFAASLPQQICLHLATCAKTGDD